MERRGFTSQAFLSGDLRNGRPEEAEQISRQSLEIERKLLGNEHPSVVETLIVLGMVLSEQGKLADAKAPYTEALALSQKLFGKDHHLVAKALSGLGGMLAAEGRLVEAESLLHDAVATQRKVLGNDHFDLTWTLHDLGSVLERQGKLAEAEDCYREVLEIRKRLSANPRGHLLLRLASVLRKQGKLSQADALLPDTIEAFRKQRDLGEIGAQNAIAWLWATNPDPALRDGRGAVTYAEKAVAGTRRTNAMYLDTLAAAHAEAGDFPQTISVQKETNALNKNEALNEELASRLKLYESGSPYRERE